jgi:hypothetical protein
MNYDSETLKYETDLDKIFERKTGRGNKDSMWYKINSGGSCPEETSYNLLQSYSQEFRCLTQRWAN